MQNQVRSSKQKMRIMLKWRFMGFFLFIEEKNMHALCEHLDIYLKKWGYRWSTGLYFFIYMIKDLIKSVGGKLRLLAILGVWCQFGKQGIFLLLLDVFPLNTGMNFNSTRYPYVYIERQIVCLFQQLFNKPPAQSIRLIPGNKTWNKDDIWNHFYSWLETMQILLTSWKILWVMLKTSMYKC